MNLYNELKSICTERKSIREFSDQSIDDKIIEEIRTIANTSPFASGKKNWDILVVKDRSIIQKLADIVKINTVQTSDQIREDFRDSFLEYSDKFTIFINAPVVLIPTYRVPNTLSYMIDSDSIRQWERDNYVKSISCVGMLILLAVQSLGLSSCYMTGPLLYENELISILPIKGQHRLGAIIPIGYKKQTNPKENNV